MLCTKECFDELKKTYFENYETISSYGLLSQYEHMLFLLNNLHYDEVDSICVNKVIEKREDLLSDFSDYNDEYYIILSCFANSNCDNNFKYNLILKSEPHYYGYCDCNEHSDGYYEEHLCCGKGCDYDEYFFVENHYSGRELRVLDYQEYMFFDFLRELKGDDVKLTIEKRKADKIISYIEYHKKKIEELKLSAKECNLEIPEEGIYSYVYK